MAEATPKKVSTTESGHAKNIANFGALVNSVEDIGSSYNPSVADIKLSNLRLINTKLEKILPAVFAAEAPYKLAVNARQTAFDGMSKLATRVINSLAVAGSDREIKDAKTILKKIRGGKAIKPEDPALAAKTRSTSQMSYDNRVSNFKELTALLAAIPAYKPNEADLKVAALNAYLDKLPGLGATVNKTALALTTARANRDQLLYAKGTGALAISLKVKKYVKSMSGAATPAYKKLSKLVFYAR
ncbi:hypothetical protein HY768_04695 [candidate division TA06 bacterium]|uniref:Uncharacterized protein n=1 Tax=candidate division TA06 bacterium TaxID=2250710 RepID=A0A933MHX0_UNCT6|nr:hypothetical protein [candidate division TA06 bacterium]